LAEVAGYFAKYIWETKKEKNFLLKE